jgi:beta-glucosidase-like glycosyl hydrolase
LTLPVNLGIASAAYQKAASFVGLLTNVQKIQVITNQKFSTGNLTWNGYEGCDGVDGVNNQAFVSGFSTAAAVGMTWNAELAQAQYQALGKL